MFEILNNIPVLGPILGTVIPFLIVLSIVVAIHEYGHYIVGRWCGIHAETFSLGFGRVIKSWTDKRGTKWQIAIVPLGGYVKFLGDMNSASTESGEIDETLDDREKGRYFAGAKLYKRALTVFAGPAANFILSTVVFAGLVIWSGKPSGEPIIGEVHPAISQNFDLRAGDTVRSIDGIELENFSDLNTFLDQENPSQIMPYSIERGGSTLTVDGPFPFQAIVGAVTPVSPASKAGLQIGDVILSFDGTNVATFEELKTLIFGSEPAEREMTILRNGDEMTISIFPRSREFQGSDGSIQKQVSIGVVSGHAFTGTLVGVGPFEALKIGVERTWTTITSSVKSISLLITGQIAFNNLQGPVGIAHVAGDIAKSGLTDLIALVAILSTAIGFFNLLPIPVLDGGHLLMFAYEAITRRRPNERVVQIGTIASLSLLLTMMVFITYNDIIRLVLYWT